MAENPAEQLASPPESAPPPPQPSALAAVFFGRQGLRTGWGLLLFLSLFLGLGSLLRYLPLGSLAGPNPSHLITPAHAIVEEALLFGLTLFVSFLLSRIERRPVAAYGLGSPLPRAGQFLAGLFWGLASLSLLVAILFKLNLLHFNARLLSGPGILRYAAIWLLGFLLVGLAEEYLMRGYLQFTLTRGLTAIANTLSSFFSLQLQPSTATTIGFCISAAILSFAFGLGHSSNPGESPLGLVSAGLAGLVFCLALWRTGSLWWAVGFHCTWDWAQSFLYGVGDSGSLIQGRLFNTSPVGKPILSGGLTGPEGSIYVLPTLALVAAVLLLTLPKQPTPIEAATAPPSESPAA